MKKKRVPVARPGGRSARVREEVQGALRWLLQRKPQAEISIPDIAERSGVHAATIYRRWGTVQGLMLDMTVDRISQESPMPDTGTLEGDLYAWGRRLAAAVAGPDGPVLMRTIVQAKPSERGALLRRAEDIQAVLDRASARGETVLRYTDILDGVLAPIFMRQLMGVDGLDDALVRQLVRRTIGAERR
jgi:AcrR family transcriptional regulator